MIQIYLQAIFDKTECSDARERSYYTLCNRSCRHLQQVLTGRVYTLVLRQQADSLFAAVESVV